MMGLRRVLALIIGQTPRTDLVRRLRRPRLPPHSPPYSRYSLLQCLFFISSLPQGLASAIQYRGGAYCCRRRRGCTSGAERRARWHRSGRAAVCCHQCCDSKNKNKPERSAIIMPASNQVCTHRRWHSVSYSVSAACSSRLPPFAPSHNQL